MTVVGRCGRFSDIKQRVRGTQTADDIVGAGFKPALAQRTTPIRWQRGHYDQIIRHEEALDRIRAHFANNPARWAHDPENIPRAVSAEAGRV